MCKRHFCENCGQELIHRDNRKFYESSSALGQILWSRGPFKMGGTDIDFVSEYTTKNGSIILRVMEQKQIHHTFRWSQRQILTRIAQMIDHCKKSPDFDAFNIHEESGLYLLKGQIEAADSPHKETRFKGEQIFENILNGNQLTINSEEEFFRILDPEDGRRRNGKKK